MEKNKFEIAEKYLNENETEKALNMLIEIAENVSDKGRLAYDLGIVGMQTSNFDSALNFFKAAVESGFENSDLYYQMINILGLMGKLKEADSLFDKAFELANNDDERFALFDVQISMYMQNDMLLNADKSAKQMIKMFSNDYQGYHYYYLIQMEKKDYETALAFMDIVPDSLKTNSDYLKDYLELIKMNSEDDFYAAIENDDVYKKEIPSYVLKALYEKAHDEENLERMLEILQELSSKHGDLDSLLGLMILTNGMQEYEDSYEIANTIIELTKNKINAYSMFAMYYQMFNMFHLHKDSLSQEYIDWIENASKTCVGYFSSIGEQEITDTILESINTLFDEINAIIANY